MGDEKQVRSPLMIVESFLTALTSADKDGRIVITKTGLSSYTVVTTRHHELIVSYDVHVFMCIFLQLRCQIRG